MLAWTWYRMPDSKTTTKSPSLKGHFDRTCRHAILTQHTGFQLRIGLQTKSTSPQQLGG